MLYFRELVKNTLRLKYEALRYQLMFWHSVQNAALLQETHSLDYVPATWVVSEISSLHNHMVYDSATLFSFFEYGDPDGLFLTIKQMTVDFELFPKLIRSFDIFKSELDRVKFSFKLERSIEYIITKDKDNNFFFSNLCIPRHFKSRKWRWFKNRQRHLRKKLKTSKLNSQKKHF